MEPSLVKTFTAQNFQTEVLDAPGVTVVDFWAIWCGPCRMLAPIVERLAEALDGKASVGKLDVDANGSLAATHGVMSIPTLLVFKDGREAERLVGVRPFDELLAIIEKHLTLLAQDGAD